MKSRSAPCFHSLPSRLIRRRNMMSRDSRELPLRARGTNVRRAQRAVHRCVRACTRSSSTPSSTTPLRRPSGIGYLRGPTVRLGVDPSTVYFLKPLHTSGTSAPPASPPAEQTRTCSFELSVTNGSCATMTVTNFTSATQLRRVAGRNAGCSTIRNGRRAAPIAAVQPRERRRTQSAPHPARVP